MRSHPARDKSLTVHPKEATMELTPLQTTSRPAQRPVQLILVRANGPLFYSLACASLLEADMPLAAERLLQFFGGDQVLTQWLRSEWLPRKVARAARLREYMEAMWPEYDWVAGYEHYRAVASARGCGSLRRTGVHEALARCVATAQSGVFYRSLARWAEDRRLRELARVMATEEALCFPHFRQLYDRRLRSQGLNCAAAWMTALACVRAARDAQVPRAFNAINAHCPAQAPFPVLDYPEFLTRMGAVIERHGDLGAPERMLFRTWKARPRVRVEDGAEPRRAAWFRPVLARQFG
jgi:hypothetical protein